MERITIRPKEDQNTWNFFFSVFFFVVLVGAMYLLHAMRGSWPTSVPAFDMLLMALASFRVTRLIVYDKIARWFREWFLNRREIVVDGEPMIEIVPVMQGVRHTIHDLLQCPWCIGMWSGLVVAFCYFMFPWAWFVILFLALAGLSSLIQVTANMIGWSAENLKLNARDKDLQL